MSFDILAHLDKLEPDGGSESQNEKSFLCPVCGSNNFKVELKTGKYSTFGCDCADNEDGKRKIRNALSPATNPNAKPASLKPIRPAHPGKHWDYFLPDGTKAITVHRKDDGNGTRDFRQESHIPGQFPRDLKSQVLPYGYSYAKQAEANGEQIHHVEGEGCVDAMRSRGLAAVTTLGGSKQFNPDRDGGHFNPQQVVIWPDQDDLGIEYAEKVAAAYPGCQWGFAFPGSEHWNGKRPKDGGLDVADFIADGATVENLQLCIGAKDKEPIAKRIQRVAEGFCSAAKDLKALRKEATCILQDEQIESMHRLIHLRSYAEGLDTRFTDLELKQALWSARRALHGSSTPHKGGAKLSRRKSPFFWDGVVMKEATTLFISLPKVGKSRLLCQFIARLRRGDAEFLGRKLTGPCPPIAIIGSDQDEGDWAECLHLSGLLDNNDILDPSIVALYDKGCPLHLDDEGIETIADLAAKHPGLLILLDSYFSCTSQLGLMERDSNYAGPLVDLQEAIAPHKATLVVIHHSNKAAAGATATEASRGTTALPSQSSWNVALSRRQSDNPLAPQDKRITLKSEGRGGSPCELLIEQIDDGYNWMSYGDAEDVAKQQIIEDLIDGLEPRQHDALKELCNHWHYANAPMTALALADALDISGTNPEARARETIDKLRKVRLVEQDGEQERQGTGRRKALWKPTTAALQILTPHPTETSFSSFSSIPNQKDEKDDKDEFSVTRARGLPIYEFDDDDEI